MIREPALPLARPTVRQPRRLAAGVEVETISTPERLAAIAPAWSELLHESAADSLFLTPEWMATWWRHFGESAGLELLVARAGGRLAALAPLRRAAAPRERWLGPTLQFLATGAVGSDDLDVVVRRDVGRAALEALAGGLARRGVALDLAHLPAGTGTAAGELAARLAARRWSVRRRPCAVCPVADLPAGGFEAYLARRGAAHRANFRRRLRRLEREHALRFATVSSTEELGPALEALFELHGRRWRERGGSDGLAGPAVLAFHRDFARRAFARGWLRLQVLSLDGRPAAAIYGLRYGDRHLFYQSGFDPALAPLGVGLVAMGLSIRAACEEGAREYDLLHGAEPYKFLWADRTRTLERVEALPPTASGRLRGAWRRGVDLARDLRDRRRARAIERPAAEAGT